MTIFDGARRDDDPGLDPERLARMAEATEWLHAPEPRRRRSWRSAIDTGIQFTAGALLFAIVLLLFWG